MGETLLGAWLAHIGITQKEFAERLGTTESFVSDYVNTDYKYQRRTKQKFANALGVSVEQFMEGPNGGYTASEKLGVRQAGAKVKSMRMEIIDMVMDMDLSDLDLINGMCKRIIQQEEERS